jgi:hypothetical protein
MTPEDNNKQFDNYADVNKPGPAGGTSWGSICPNCGYCPCCGRSRGNWNYPVNPVYSTMPIGSYFRETST